MTQFARLLALTTALLGGACLGSSGAPAGEVFLSAAECAAAVPWAPSTSYRVGALVTFQGATYQCIQAHTSQADWTPSAVPALWSKTSCSGPASAAHHPLRRRCPACGHRVPALIDVAAVTSADPGARHEGSAMGSEA